MKPWVVVEMKKAKVDICTMVVCCSWQLGMAKATNKSLSLELKVKEDKNKKLSLVELEPVTVVRCERVCVERMVEAIRLEL